MSVRSALFLAAPLLVAACATENPYVLGNSRDHSPCPDDLTLACTEYVGKKTRCYCASRDGLREILEPETRR
jgi:hypothetical protein